MWREIHSQLQTCWITSTISGEVSVKRNTLTATDLLNHITISGRSQCEEKYTHSYRLVESHHYIRGGHSVVWREIHSQLQTCWITSLYQGGHSVKRNTLTATDLLNHITISGRSQCEEKYTHSYRLVESHLYQGRSQCEEKYTHSYRLVESHHYIREVTVWREIHSQLQTCWITSLYQGGHSVKRNTLTATDLLNHIYYIRGGHSVKRNTLTATDLLNHITISGRSQCEEKYTHSYRLDESHHYIRGGHSVVWREIHSQLQTCLITSLYQGGHSVKRNTLTATDLMNHITISGRSQCSVKRNTLTATDLFNHITISGRSQCEEKYTHSYRLVESHHYIRGGHSVVWREIHSQLQTCWITSLYIREVTVWREIHSQLQTWWITSLYQGRSQCEEKYTHSYILV